MSTKSMRVLTLRNNVRLFHHTITCSIVPSRKYTTWRRSSFTTPRRTSRTRPTALGPSVLSTVPPHCVQILCGRGAAWSFWGGGRGPGGREEFVVNWYSSPDMSSSLLCLWTMTTTVKMTVCSCEGRNCSVDARRALLGAGG